MGNYDGRVDAYIDKSADFAKPVLNHLRQLIHTACPEVNEVMKWSFPCFEYRDKILCSMAAFKQHCAFNFWLATLMKDKHKILKRAEEKSSMGNLGQLKSLDDLPSDKIMAEYLAEGMKLIETGAKIARSKPEPKPLEIPVYLADELKKHKAAHTQFEKLSPSHKKEYVEWITEAKTDATRNKRIATTIEWLTEGKTRNWKYQNC